VKTVLRTVEIAPDAMSMGLCAALAEIGVQQVIFNMRKVHDIQPLQIFEKDIIPVVSEMV
jgi:hypothetical protein